MADVYKPGTNELMSTTPDTAARSKAETEYAVQEKMARTSLGDAAKKAANKGKPMPKLADFGGDNAAWGKAVREWRQAQDSDADVQARKRALEGMKPQ